MNRRKFIKNTSLGVLAITLPNIYLGCSDKKIALNTIIGAPETILRNAKKEGDDYLSYYTLPNFICNEFEGKEAYVYCENGRIVGYTIKKEGNDAVKNIEKLAILYGDKEKLYDTNFGVKYKWETSGEQILLSVTKSNMKIPQNVFYSKSLIGNKLIVF